MGSNPVFSFDEFMARTPSLVPLSVAGVGALLALGMAALIRALVRRRAKRKA